MAVRGGIARIIRFAVKIATLGLLLRGSSGQWPPNGPIGVAVGERFWSPACAAAQSKFTRR